MHHVADVKVIKNIDIVRNEEQRVISIDFFDENNRDKWIDGMICCIKVGCTKSELADAFESFAKFIRRGIE